jgi:hypothetical protein
MMELIQAAGLAIVCLGWTAVMLIGARQEPIAPAPASVPIFEDDEDPEPSWLT